MWCENEIEYILEHLQDPERLMDGESVEWLEKKEHLALFEKIRNQREAFLRLQQEGNIDINVEFRCFESKISSRKSLWRKGGWVAVAACMVLAMVVGIVMKNDESSPLLSEEVTDLTGKKCAELILADGQRIKLENNEIELQEGDGTLIVNDTNLQLVYLHDTTRSFADTAKLRYNILKIPSGADYLVKLSDGTRVHLNCETEFRYPVKFAAGERRVYLDGEAFFEVEKAKGWPFIVETDRMHVRVTGTKFNVKSYRSEEVVHTTLVQGTVKVNTTEDWAEAEELVPLQQYYLDKRSGQAQVKQVDTGLFTDWIEGRFVFKDQRLEEVMGTLARWYSVEVFYATPSVKNWRLSANLGRYEHIDAILKMIQATDKVEIVRKKNTITIGWK